jgi:hypothetical protein
MKTSSLLCLFLFTGISPAWAGSTVTATNGMLPDPTYIDMGDAGDSVGDQRIWQVAGKAQDDQVVTMTMIMTTTSQPGQSSDVETRLSQAVFAFGEGTGDTVLFSGTGTYPKAGSTVKARATLERAILGGTGKYAGAKGTVLTTHLSDGTWQHVFQIE